MSYPFSDRAAADERVATRDDVDPATFADRLLAETLAEDGCVVGPPMTGAWTTRPA